MLEDLPSITEADVRQLASQQSFNRGMSYYHSGAVFEPVCQGYELRAYCEGSSYEPYRVSVTLGLQGVSSTHCTCPYDWGGICKHIVALLLTWTHEPEAFRTIPPLDEILADRSREELVTLVKEMFKREPDLVRLLELPIQPGRQTPLDLDAFRRQINYALRHGFPDAEAVAVELSAIAETADRFREGGDWTNSGVLYQLILDEIVPGYPDLYDEDGDVAVVLQTCVQGLDACLSEGSPDAEARRAWLKALLEAKIKDVEIGGIDLAYPADEIIIRHATDEEWAWIEARVRQAIATRKDRYSEWGREALVSFLARRLDETDHETEANDLIFELGSPQQRAFLLVHQQRFDEAVAVAEQHFAGRPGLVTRFADALVEAGAGLAAETYIISLLDARGGRSYLAWLAEYAEEKGDLGVALDRWQQYFREFSDLRTYQTLRDLAGRVGLWERIRKELLGELEAEQKWSVWLEVALDEGDVARALELLPRVAQGWYRSDHEMCVAQAAEADYPQAALDIYRRRAERLIDARGRSNYREAASLLVRVRELCRRQDAHADWDRYISDLRLHHDRLRALKDELSKAGL